MTEIINNNFPLEEWTFRNDGAIKLPLDTIVSSFYMSVDVVIESVDYPQYKNYRILPERSFYGYAEIVENDTLLPPVEVVQPRQRIWEAWSWEAFRGWTELHEYYESQYLYNREILVQIGQGNSEEIPQYTRDPTLWTPLELREVFVRCLPNTQFRIVFNNVSPIFFTDPSGILRNGKSSATIPDNKRGLPPSGIQPKMNLPSSPFAGNNDLRVPSPTSGWYVDPSNLGSVDPSNGTDTSNPDLIWWVDATFRTQNSSYPGGCSVTRVEHFTVAVPPNTSYGGYNQTSTPVSNSCGGNNVSIQLLDGEGSPIAGATGSITVGATPEVEIKVGTSFTAVDEITYE